LEGRKEGGGKKAGLRPNYCVFQKRTAGERFPTGRKEKKLALASVIPIVPLILPGEGEENRKWEKPRSTIGLEKGSGVTSKSPNREGKIMAPKGKKRRAHRPASA